MPLRIPPLHELLGAGLGSGDELLGSRLLLLFERGRLPADERSCLCPRPPAPPPSGEGHADLVDVPFQASLDLHVGVREDL